MIKPSLTLLPFLFLFALAPAFFQLLYFFVWLCSLSIRLTLLTIFPFLWSSYNFQSCELVTPLTWRRCFYPKRVHLLLSYVWIFAFSRSYHKIIFKGCNFTIDCDKFLNGKAKSTVFIARNVQKLWLFSSTHKTALFFIFSILVTNKSPKGLLLKQLPITDFCTDCIWSLPDFCPRLFFLIPSAFYPIKKAPDSLSLCLILAEEFLWSHGFCWWDWWDWQFKRLCHCRFFRILLHPIISVEGMTHF